MIHDESEDAAALLSAQVGCDNEVESAIKSQ